MNNKTGNGTHLNGKATNRQNDEIFGFWFLCVFACLRDFVGQCVRNAKRIKNNKRTKLILLFLYYCVYAKQYFSHYFFLLSSLSLYPRLNEFLAETHKWMAINKFLRKIIIRIYSHLLQRKLSEIFHPFGNFSRSSFVKRFLNIFLCITIHYGLHVFLDDVGLFKFSSGECVSSRNCVVVCVSIEELWWERFV